MLQGSVGMENMTILVDAWYARGNHFEQSHSTNDEPSYDTYHINIGVPTIQSSVVVIAVTEVVEDPRQTEHACAKSATVIVARGMHENWLSLSFVSTSLVWILRKSKVSPLKGQQVVGVLELSAPREAMHKISPNMHKFRGPT